MMKLMPGGVWAAVVLASTFFVSHKLGLSQMLTKLPGEHSDSIDVVATDFVRVPVFKAGKAAGYVLVRLNIGFGSSATRDVKNILVDVVTDEAFRAIYESTAIDFEQANKSNLTSLMQQIGTEADQRLGGGLVNEVMVREFTFLPLKIDRQ